MSRPTLIRCALVVAGGVILYLSFPPTELWWLAPIGIVAFAAVVHDRRPGAAFWYGYLFGAAFLFPLINWVGTYVGPIATVPLVAAESVAFGLLGIAVAQIRKLPAAPFWAACLWVGVEALRSRVPFGGFPWGRLAFGQPEGKFLPLAALGGAPLLSFAVALTGFGLAALVHVAVTSRANLRPTQLISGVVCIVLPLCAGLASAPLVDTGAENGTATIAVVQGDVPRAGLEFSSQRRAVLDNHAARTEELAADVAAGRVPQPDVVIWPENASDLDPYLSPDAEQVIEQAVEAIGVPTLVGTVLLTGERYDTTNTVLVWEPGTGPVERYDKRRILPFGEYMPFRSFFRLFTSQVDEAGNFVSGDEDAVVTANGIRIGLAICWEVAFDGALTDAARDDAEILVVPTNNATFGRTDMTYQQLAMSRVRAVEHGRAVLVAATSGVSAVISPDGSVLQETDLFTPDVLVAQVPRRTSTTLATDLGAAPEWVLTALGAFAVAIVGYRNRSGSEGLKSEVLERLRRHRRAPKRRARDERATHGGWGRARPGTGDHPDL